MNLFFQQIIPVAQKRLLIGFVQLVINIEEVFKQEVMEKIVLFVERVIKHLCQNNRCIIM